MQFTEGPFKFPPPPPPLYSEDPSATPPPQSRKPPPSTGFADLRPTTTTTASPAPAGIFSIGGGTTLRPRLDPTLLNNGYAFNQKHHHKQQKNRKQQQQHGEKRRDQQHELLMAPVAPRVPFPNQNQNPAHHPLPFHQQRKPSSQPQQQPQQQQQHHRRPPMTLKNQGVKPPQGSFLVNPFSQFMSPIKSLLSPRKWFKKPPPHKQQQPPQQQHQQQKSQANRSPHPSTQQQQQQQQKKKKKKKKRFGLETSPIDVPLLRPSKGVGSHRHSAGVGAGEISVPMELIPPPVNFASFATPSNNKPGLAPGHHHGHLQQQQQQQRDNKLKYIQKQLQQQQSQKFFQPNKMAAASTAAGKDAT